MCSLHTPGTMQELQQKHVIDKGPHAGCLGTKVYQGSCCYILLAEAVDRETSASLPAPLALESCRVIYAYEPCRQFEAARPYLRQDQLVTHTSFIPGILRSDGVLQRTVDYAEAPVGKYLEHVVQQKTQSIELQGISFSVEATAYKCASVCHLTVNNVCIMLLRHSLCFRLPGTPSLMPTYDTSRSHSHVRLGGKFPWISCDVAVMSLIVPCCDFSGHLEADLCTLSAFIGGPCPQTVLSLRNT